MLQSFLLPSFHCRTFQISAGTDGTQLRAPDLSGHCWASTASSRSQWTIRAPDLSGQCRTSTASSRSQCALPDLNCKLQKWAAPDLNHEPQISVGTAGLQPRGPADLWRSRLGSGNAHVRENVRIDARLECQIECQNRMSKNTCHIYICMYIYICVYFQMRCRKL